MTLNELLAESKRVREAATKGKWEVRLPKIDMDDTIPFIRVCTENRNVFLHEWEDEPVDSEDIANAEFIVFARNNLERMERAIEMLTDCVRGLEVAEECYRQSPTVGQWNILRREGDKARAALESLDE